MTLHRGIEVPAGWEGGSEACVELAGLTQQRQCRTRLIRCFLGELRVSLPSSSATPTLEAPSLSLPPVSQAPGGGGGLTLLLLRAHTDHLFIDRDGLLPSQLPSLWLGDELSACSPKSPVSTPDISLVVRNPTLTAYRPAPPPAPNIAPILIETHISQNSPEHEFLGSAYKSPLHSPTEPTLRYPYYYFPL